MKITDSGDCKEHEWARLWLQANNYREIRYCRKCFFEDRRYKQQQESIQNRALAQSG